MDTFLRLRRKFKFHKVKLTYRSLGRMSMYILGFFILLSFIWTKFFPSGSDSRYAIMALKNYKVVEKELSEELKAKPANAKLWRMLVSLRVMIEQTPNKIDIQEVNPLNPESQNLGKQEFFFTQQEFLSFLETSEDPSPEMLKIRYRLLKNRDFSKITYHNRSAKELEEIARILLELNQLSKSMEVSYLILETDKENSFAKETIMYCLARTGQFDEIRDKIQDADWRQYASHYILHEYYLQNGSYGKMLYHLTLSQYELYTWKNYLTCGIAGFGWVLFLMHLGSAWFWKRKEQIYIPIALSLGFVSTIFCLGVVVIQDHFLNHTGFVDKSIIYNLAYCILGISLREELCKLIFFLPILFFVKNVREDYKILCYCSLVGLGFSIEENLGYFLKGEGAIMGRFLTANFAHTFLTGFTCFYLVKAVQRGGNAWDEFTTTFLKMILIHGIYDFFLIDPTMVSKGMDFFAMMLYVYVALLYLRLLMNTSPPAHQFVSLTRVFTIVLCCTVGVTLLMISSEIGIKPALKSIANGIVAYAIFAYMFYREFNEHIG